MAMAGGHGQGSIRSGLRALERARQARIERAREDVNTFIELVAKDTSKQTQDSIPVVQRPVHLQMQKDIDEHRRYIIMSHPQSGKTTQVIMRAIWEIGRNPNIRIVIASKQKTVKSGTGWEIFNAIRALVDDPLVREVFPQMGRGPIWTQDTFTVKRSMIDKSPTCKLGAAKDRIKGSRVDLLILDDWYDEQSCESPTERKRLRDWVFEIQDRLSPGGRIIACCNAIHPDDPAHHIEKMALSNPGKFKWVVRRFPVYEPPDYDLDISKVRLVSPHIFSRKKIEEERNNNPQLTFQRLYLCNAIDEAGSVFDHTSVHRAFRSPDEPEGEGTEPFPELRLKDQLELGIQIVVGVDLAISEKPSADKTCLTAVAYWPDEDVRQVLWIESGRWRGDVIAQKIIEWDQRFRPTMIMVETSGQQGYLLDTIRLQAENERLRGHQTPTPPIRGFRTGVNKWHRTSGVESISTEITAGRWRFPAIIPERVDSIQCEAAQLRTAMLNYVRGQHTGDHLMSLWLANQGVRLIAYDEEDDRSETEVDRAIDRVQDLVYRYRPEGVDHKAEILTTDAALEAWEKLRVDGVDLVPFSDDYTALITTWTERDDDHDAYDIPDPEQDWNGIDTDI